MVLIAWRLDAARARELVEERSQGARCGGDVWAEYFLSTPDLVFRVREGIEV